jgi:hypothetical protein
MSIDWNDQWSWYKHSCQRLARNVQYESSQYTVEDPGSSRLRGGTVLITLWNYCRPLNQSAEIQYHHVTCMN